MVFGAPAAPSGDGQYHIVVAGEVRSQNSTLERLSCGFIEAAAEPPLYQASAEGAAIMICQFPRAG
jgi:hypothetical protein